MIYLKNPLSLRLNTQEYRETDEEEDSYAYNGLYVVRQPVSGFGNISGTGESETPIL